MQSLPRGSDDTDTLHQLSWYVSDEGRPGAEQDRGHGDFLQEDLEGQRQEVGRGSALL